MNDKSDYCDQCKKHWLKCDGNGAWGNHPIPGVFFKGIGRQEKSLTDFTYRCGKCREAVWEERRRHEAKV